MPVSFSVIIPLFNKVGQVERAIRSVFSQTHLPHEVIVVDDGSTDGSFEKVQELKKYYDISLHSQANSGAASARNTGAKICCSDYVCFLDADDEWHPDHLLELLGLIESSSFQPILASTRNCFNINEAGETVSYPSYRTVDDVLGIFKNFRNVISSSSACILRAELIEVGGFPEGAVHGEDLSLWYRLALRGATCLSPRKCAIIHNDAKFRVSASRLREVPHHIRYFTNKNGGRINLEIESLRNLLAQSAVRNSLGLSILKEPCVFVEYCWRSFILRPTATAFILMISLVPFPLRKMVLNLSRQRKSRQ